jgi:hypothetical protein
MSFGSQRDAEAKTSRLLKKYFGWLAKGFFARERCQNDFVRSLLEVLIMTLLYRVKKRLNDKTMVLPMRSTKAPKARKSI